MSPFRSIVRAARRNASPLPAFNIVDASSLQGVIRAAGAVNVPVIAQFSARTVQFYGARVVRDLVSGTAVDVECFLHLDHCSDDAVLGAAMDAGFDGVMADGSHLPFEDNVRWTRGWAERGHARDVLVEGELGVIVGAEEGMAGGEGGETPDVESYLEFARQTGVDLLGADIGTAHGHYDAPPDIRYELLEGLAPRDAPGFVVHGGSGLSAETLQRLAGLRAVKFNFSTALKEAWVRGVSKGLSNESRAGEPLAVLASARAAVAAMAEETLRLFGMEV